MNAHETMVACRHAWERTQPQLFFELDTELMGEPTAGTPPCATAPPTAADSVQRGASPISTYSTADGRSPVRASAAVGMEVTA